MLIYRSALASRTLISDISGDNITEKRANMVEWAKIYLDLRRRPETVDLEVPLNFDNAAVHIMFGLMYMNSINI